VRNPPHRGASPQPWPECHPFRLERRPAADSPWSPGSSAAHPVHLWHTEIEQEASAARGMALRNSAAEEKVRRYGLGTEQPRDGLRNRASSSTGTTGGAGLSGPSFRWARKGMKRKALPSGCSRPDAAMCPSTSVRQMAVPFPPSGLVVERFEHFRQHPGRRRDRCRHRDLSVAPNWRALMIPSRRRWDSASHPCRSPAGSSDLL
jgi:hypothetical protein